MTADAAQKARAAHALNRAWLEGAIGLAGTAVPMPDRPARPARPVLLSPGAMPRRGKAGSARSRFALLHALAHIELNAIDLAIDIAGRWGPGMPRAFASDWLTVADEEARHFALLTDLLAKADGAYGDLPAHDGLWDAARQTSGDLMARLAIVPQVLEARGLDVTPPMIARFEAAGDIEVAQALQTILTDEIGHVDVGNRWFRHLCRESSYDPATLFRKMVNLHFRGMVKPPFNDSARRQAGLTMDWYSGLGTARPASKP